MAFSLLKFLISLIYFYNQFINKVLPSDDGLDRSTSTSDKGWLLFNPYQCGISNTDRIIGGQTAALGQFPWIARLGYESYEMPIFRCGGSLISEEFILTAAHCVENLPIHAPLTVIRLGENFADQKIDCESGVCAPLPQDVYPEEVIVHDEYHRMTHQNDIALVRLKHKVKFNDYVSPICLPYGALLKYNLVGKKLEVAGWGFTDAAVNKMSTRLNFVKINSVPLKNCVQVYRFLPITDTQICAGGEVGKDSCAGDSGGPLMKVEAFKGPPRYFLIGVVSFGDIRCGSNMPAVYTDIRHFSDWITKYI